MIQNGWIWKRVTFSFVFEIEVMWDEKGRDTLRGFLAQLMACGLNGLPVSRMWSGNVYDGPLTIGKIIPREMTELLLKHFRFASPKNLPQKGENGWHPLQNILKGIDFIKSRSLLLWKAGLCKHLSRAFECKISYMRPLCRRGQVCEQIFSKCLQNSKPQ